MAAFVETMRGWLREPSGAEHPVAFEIRAAGRRGEHAIEGVISAPPWVAEAVAAGALVIDPRAPAIRYRLEFTAADGTPLELRAEKTPSLRAPLRSMTWMPATLRAGDRVLAEGSLTFDLRDLPSFLASLLPLPRATGALRRLEARRRLLERRAFTGEPA